MWSDFTNSVNLMYVFDVIAGIIILIIAYLIIKGLVKFTINTYKKLIGSKLRKKENFKAIKQVKAKELQDIAIMKEQYELTNGKGSWAKYLAEIKRNKAHKNSKGRK